MADTRRLRAVGKKHKRDQNEFLPNKKQKIVESEDSSESFQSDQVDGSDNEQCLDLMHISQNSSVDSN